MSDVAALEAVVIRQRQRETRRWQFLMIFIVLIGCSILFDIATGPSLLPVSDVAHALFQPGSAEPMTKTIVYEMRLPIALMALVVGAALGLGGVQMQTLLDNPLASPFTLGLAAAGGFGAALALVTSSSLCVFSLLAIPLEAVVIRQRQRETRRWQFLMIFIVLIGCSILSDIVTGK